VREKKKKKNRELTIVAILMILIQSLNVSFMSFLFIEKERRT
jgi:hypothetical protein